MKESGELQQTCKVSGGLGMGRREWSRKARMQNVRFIPRCEKAASPDTQLGTIKT